MDEIGQRILNGDGGGWIKEPYDPDTIFQLNRYHIYQRILRKIGDKKVQKEIRELFTAEKTEEMLEYIQIYADSVAGDDKISCHMPLLEAVQTASRKAFQAVFYG